MECPSPATCFSQDSYPGLSPNPALQTGLAFTSLPSSGSPTSSLRSTGSPDQSVSPPTASPLQAQSLQWPEGAGLTAGT